MALVVRSTGMLVVETPETLRRVCELLKSRRAVLDQDIAMLDAKLTELQYRELDERAKEEKCREREPVGTGDSSPSSSAA